MASTNATRDSRAPLPVAKAWTEKPGMGIDREDRGEGEQKTLVECEHARYAMSGGGTSIPPRLLLRLEAHSPRKATIARRPCLISAVFRRKAFSSSPDARFRGSKAPPAENGHRMRDEGRWLHAYHARCTPISSFSRRVELAVLTRVDAPLAVELAVAVELSATDSQDLNPDQLGDVEGQGETSVGGSVQLDLAGVNPAAWRPSRG
jgi:hypothetical protein